MYEYNRRRRRFGERVKSAIGVTLTVIVVLLLVGWGVSRTGLFDLAGLLNIDQDGSTAAANDASDPDPAFTPALTISSPFEGTPAADFGEFDKLEFPEARSTKHFSEKQVAGALDDVRDLLKVGRIDWTHGDQDEDDFVKRFASHEQGDVREEMDDKNRPAYVSELAKGRSLVAEPRVSGSIEVDEESQPNGVRAISVNLKLVWAYAFDGPIHAYGDNLLVLNTQGSILFYLDGQVRPGDDGMRLGAFQFWAQNIECDVFDEGYLSAYKYDPAAIGDGTTQDPDKVYDPNADLSTLHPNCRNK